MLGLLAAERMKLLGHRGTWTLTWIFPLALAALALIFTAVRVAQGEPATPPKLETPEEWVRDTAAVWAGPRHIMGLFAVCGLAGLVFGSEYGWNTWKLVTPHAARWRLVLAKYVTLVAALAVSLVLFGLVAVGMSAFFGAAFGPGVPEGIGLDAVLAAHGKGALAAAPYLLLTIALASAAAVILRSAMGGTIVAAVATAAFEIAYSFAPMIERKIYVALPSYHLRNLKTWATNGLSLPQGLPDGLLSLEWSMSLAVVAAWTLVPVALAFLVFERQDLN